MEVDVRLWTWLCCGNRHWCKKQDKECDEGTQKLAYQGNQIIYYKFMHILIHLPNFV